MSIYIFFIASFLVSCSHEKFVEKNRWFRGGAIVESGSSLVSDPHNEAFFPLENQETRVFTLRARSPHYCY